MKTLRGAVTKIKIIQFAESPLVRFTINNKVNCLIAKHSLNFLYEVPEESFVILGGDFNGRKQFVVSRYFVKNEWVKNKNPHFINST